MRRAASGPTTLAVSVSHPRGAGIVGSAARAAHTASVTVNSANPLQPEGARRRKAPRLGDGVGGHRKRAARPADEHWTGPRCRLRLVLIEMGDDALDLGQIGRDFR